MTVYCLIRFGEREYIEKFMNEGEMKFSLLAEHQKSSEDERGDDLEGAVSIINDEIVKVDVDHPTLGKHTFNVVPGTLSKMVHYAGRPIGSFCTYAVTDTIVGDKEVHYIDEKMRKFGDYALVIPSHHMDGYFARVRAALDALKLKYSYGHVEYKDLNARGDLGGGFFTKGLAYAHQSEHRIIVYLDKEEPLYLRIGSIKDLCICSSTDGWLRTEFKFNQRQIPG